MGKVIYTELNEHELEEMFTRALRNSQQGIQVNNDNSDALNQREAAEYLGISQTTIIKWKKDGKVPYEQITGSSKVRYYKSQLKAVVQRNPHLLQAARK